MTGFLIGLAVLVCLLVCGAAHLVLGTALLIGAVALIYQPLRLIRRIRNDAARKAVLTVAALLIWTALGPLISVEMTNWIGAAVIVAIDLALFWLLTPPQP